MTQAQKETIQFYTTNDYLLINGLLWREDEDTIDAYIRLINEDGRGVMEEARTQGADVRWNCSKEEGERLFQLFEKRFPVIDHDNVKKEIISRAKADIQNLMDCMEPLENDLVLYRNIKTKFVAGLQEGQTLHYLGFSSCSLNPHPTGNAMYGSSSCTLFEIRVPAGTPAIRLDRMPEIQNEPDEVILPPMEFRITDVHKETSRISMIYAKNHAM